MTRRKTYAIEERMSGDWIERWTGFSSRKKANIFLRRMKARYGPLRLVRITRKILGDR